MNRQKLQANNSNESKEETKASTLPRRRGEVSPDISTSRNSSPRASTPSLDSAVGSAEGLGVPQIGLSELQPRSDSSDSLATSSALTSPEPQVHEIPEPRIELVQPEVNNEFPSTIDGHFETQISDSLLKGL